MIQESGSDSTTRAATELLDIIRELVAGLRQGAVPEGSITLDTSLDRGLGLSSLARVELLVRIERHYSCSLPERIFADAETPRDLLRAVLSAATARTSDTSAAVTALQLDTTEGAPTRANTLVDALDWHVQAHGDRPHIRFYSDEGEGDIITYRELNDKAQAVAEGLQSRGLQQGEPVAVMLPTGKDYFFTFFGILLGGGVPVPIYPPASRKRIEGHLQRHRAILTNCGAATLVTIPEAKTFSQLLKSQASTLDNVTTPEELTADPQTYRKPALGGRDLAFLQYTSGSTGNPKGVALTHANLLANIRAMGEATDVTSNDVFVSWLPLYHDMGLIGAWFASLYHAMLLVIMSPLAFLARPQRWLWAVHRHRGTFSAGPNFAYELCLQRLTDADLEGLDLSSWKGALNGAEPVSADTVERFCKRFGEYGFKREAMMPVFGLAENSVGLAFPPMGRPPLIDRIQRELFTTEEKAVRTEDSDASAQQIVACGRPLRGHQIRIVDGTGRELPDRHVGRLQFRGPSACQGYFRNPDATRQLFKGDWLDSGDLAYVADGDLYVTGREKDMIIRAGRNIYPQELEDIAGDVPGVNKGNVAVFGSESSESGTERLVVLAETRKKDDGARGELRAEITARLSDVLGAPPDDVVLAPPGTVLKTSSGKIRRAASREIYEKGEIGKRRQARLAQVIRFTLAGMVPRWRRTSRAMGAGLYGAYVWTLASLCSIIAWTGAMLLPRLRWRWSLMRGMIRFMSRAFCIPISAQRLEHLPKDQACVLVSNHASYVDGFVLTGVLPEPVTFVAKAEFIGHPVAEPFLRRLRAEFAERFDREKGLGDARRLQETVQAGHTLLFFAEATFTRVPGLLPFHMGAFTAAAEAEVPVVPIAIRGTRSILRAQSWLPRRGAVTVTIGEPIMPERTSEGATSSWETALKLRNAAREHILRYCGEPDMAHEKSPLPDMRP